jgi:hypothetical protein
MTAGVLTVWNVVASVVYVLAACVALALARGELDAVSFAYYGVAADWRTPILLALLAALQVVWIGDAIVLGLRLKSAPLWAVLVLAAIVGPFALVVVLGQLDGWRYDHHSNLANLVGGATMMLVIGTVYSLRRWAFRTTGTRRA